MTGLVGLLGVILGVLLGKAVERFLDLRRRRDRQVDMAFALHAEIAAAGAALADQSEPTEASYLLASASPAGPADRTDFVFDSLKADLSILPREVIHQTVLYYRLAEQSNLMVEFLASPTYAALSEDERQKFGRNILAGIADQRIAAKAALDALEIYIGSCGFPVPVRSRVRSDEGTNGAAHDRSPSSATTLT